MTQKPNIHSAAPSALGYLYQIRYALFESIRRTSVSMGTSIYFERLDDVEFEAEGSPTELFQLKHHINREASLTNSSEDIWKSIRAWITADSEDAILYLVTTATASDGSTAMYLRTEDRDPIKALKLLESTAITSTNQNNKPAYDAFLELSPLERKKLVESIYVLDTSCHINDLPIKIKSEIRFAVSLNHIDSFFERLEGWWLQKAISNLTNPDENKILHADVENKISDLREQFQPTSLPIDDDIANSDVDDVTRDRYLDEIFVQQLRLIGISNNRVLFAMRDYFRAYEQRSRWMREDLINIGELDKYERRLREAWEIRFEQMRDELGNTKAEDEKNRLARALYAWVEDRVIPIRSCDEPFITRGSYHILSNALNVGWHLDFLERLRHLLTPSEAIS